LRRATRFGVSGAGLVAAVLALLLLALAVIDLEHHLLPDRLTLSGLVAGLIANAFGMLVTPLDALLGAAVGAALPYLVIVGYRLVRGVEGMGLGDVKLLAMIGAFLGWRGALLTLCLGAVVGAVVGISLIAARRGRLDTELPFGTFLSAAALLVLFLGPRMMVLLGWVGP
jgi:leader peptidase (prepilin peptidase)/N-methyltransferase